MKNHLAGQYWSNWQLTLDAKKQSSQQSTFVDWAGHPSVWGLVSNEVFGFEGRRSVNSDFAELIARAVSHLERPRALSLCCGDGEFELGLMQREVIASIDGLDIASARVEAAKMRLEMAPFLGLECRFFVEDVNRLVLKPRSYDLVIAKSALHHVESLERLFEEVYWALCPEGSLVAIDFFGPSRFQWTDRQLELAQSFWNERVPDEIRRRARAEGLATIPRLSLDAMMELDPSEAARSSEIMSAALELFRVDSEIPLGGTILNLLLWGNRVNYFDPHNKLHNCCLEQAFKLERQLIREGAIQSDFRAIVLKPRVGSERHA